MKQYIATHVATEHWKTTTHTEKTYTGTDVSASLLEGREELHGPDDCTTFVSVGNLANNLNK